MRAEIYWIERIPKGRLAVLPRPRGGDWLEDEVRSLRAAGVDVLVSVLTPEEAAELDLGEEAACCAAGGIEFLSFPFADRGVPVSTPDTLALVRRLAAFVADGKAVAIHCRQGVGRSAALAACVLASLGEMPERALDRVAAARGCPVPDTVEQREWVLRFAEAHLKRAGNTTLLLSSPSLPAAAPLAEAARAAGWAVRAWDANPPDPPAGRIVYYGGTDVAMQVAARFRLALLEPPLDLLARLPASLLLREVRFAHFRDLSRLRKPAFVKPADPLDKCFDAGTYADPRDIRAPRGINPDTPVLVAEPVEWLAEYRWFVRDGAVVASSPYLSFGRPVWRAWGQGGEKATPSKDALAVCGRLLASSALLPPAFVVDVGLIDGRGWAVVEFNPAWCSGLLGANPAAVLGVLDRACRGMDGLDANDAAWVVAREWPERKSSERDCPAAPRQSGGHRKRGLR
jgi:protein-tyrosine phosphatase